MKIAIDGPAGSGKSTIAKEIARRLNIIYVDTGAMYRALTLKLLNENEIDYEKILADTKIEFKQGLIFLDGKDVSQKIRTNSISNKTSELSKNPLIRDFLVKLQQKISETHSVVMEGRDIGSVVLPDANYKFFLTAKPEERARRRYLQQKEKGYEVSYDDILNDIKERDFNDSNRKISPLTKTDDAQLIDSTNLNYEETIEKILSYINRWNMLYRFLKFLFAIIFKIFYRIELYNKDNIPNHNKNLIICGNHSSNLDPIILTVYFDRPIYWMGKKELLKIRF